MLNKFKNKLKNTSFFWRFRHLIQADTWLLYYNDYVTERRNFYTQCVKKYKCNTVFEFGCASGPNLKNIEIGSPDKTFLFGVDVSKAAIEFAKDKFNPQTSFFSHKISERQIETKLAEWRYSFFDLAIYDRVLCLLTEKEISDHFSRFNNYLKVVVIDDFHNSQNTETNGKYTTRNYEDILANFGFQLVALETSEHLLGDDTFFAKNAKRIVFKKI